MGGENDAKRINREKINQEKKRNTRQTEYNFKNYGSSYSMGDAQCETSSFLKINK